MTILTASHLTIGYRDGTPVVQDASFAIGAGECLALVGQSGSGKTTIARAILGLLPPGAVARGGLHLGDTDLLAADEAAFRALRGRSIGYVAQDPYQACDPLRPVHDHVVDAWQVHGMRSPDRVALDRLSGVGIAQAETVIWDHPHTWSGGMLQRASIVAARAHNPPLVVADEPTSALDAARADETIAALKASGSAVLLISHDLDLVMRHADRVAICHRGRIVEIGTPHQLETAPRDDYTRRFVRAARVVTQRRARGPVGGAPLLVADGMSRAYRRGNSQQDAVKGASLSIHPGEIVGITGPSGCGKSTLLRMLAGIERPSDGKLQRDAALNHPGAIMPIFQDPVASLDSRWPVWRSVSEPLTAGGMPKLSRHEREQRARVLLAQLGLGDIDTAALPGELSTGQCQRISVARASIARPRLLVADEPTSALDTLAAAQVLDLLDTAARDGTAILLVSHDRNLLNAFCHRVVEMDQGVLRH